MADSLMYDLSPAEHRHDYYVSWLQALAMVNGHPIPNPRQYGDPHMDKALTFDAVTAANLSRCDRWHKGGIEDWTSADWAVAMMGEAGEVCNALKKLKRVENEIANTSADPDRILDSQEKALAKIGEELADTFLYLNLLACRLSIHLPTEIVKKFNTTSELYGFPERL